jgi:hypothetical protein
MLQTTIDMTVLDFAIIGVPLIIVLVAILSRTAKGARRRDDRLAEMKKAIAATHLRVTRVRSRKTENELAAVRFVPIGVIPISASRSE